MNGGISPPVCHLDTTERERDVSYQIHRPAPVRPRFRAYPVDNGLCESDNHPSRVGEQKRLCPLRDSNPDYPFIS